MKIWVTRHGQTNLNKNSLMQGLTDEPLNDYGREQAHIASTFTKGVRFDAVYASPLKRAVETASIISGFPDDKIIKDERIIEVDFGRYEKMSYKKLGFRMTMYWLLPEVFRAPDSVETIAHMVERSTSFLEELKGKDYENVLIVCHGGIIRAICGCLEGRRKKIRWRPKPKNCEIRVYEYDKASVKLISDFLPDSV